MKLRLAVDIDLDIFVLGNHHNNSVALIKMLKFNNIGNASSYFIMGSGCFQQIELVGYHKCFLYLDHKYDVSHNIIWKYIPSKEFSRSNTLKSLTHLNLYGDGESDDDLDQKYNDHPIVLYHRIQSLIRGGNPCGCERSSAASGTLTQCRPVGAEQTSPWENSLSAAIL